VFCPRSFEETRPQIDTELVSILPATIGRYFGYNNTQHTAFDNTKPNKQYQTLKTPIIHLLQEQMDDSQTSNLAIKSE
jgi:hypothetical protein